MVVHSHLPIYNCPIPFMCLRIVATMAIKPEYDCSVFPVLSISRYHSCYDSPNQYEADCEY